MKTLVHCMVLALAACGGSDFTNLPEAAPEQVQSSVVEPARDKCRPEGDLGAAPGTEAVDKAACPGAIPGQVPVEASATNPG